MVVHLQSFHISASGDSILLFIPAKLFLMTLLWSTTILKNTDDPLGIVPLVFFQRLSSFHYCCSYQSGSSQTMCLDHHNLLLPVAAPNLDHPQSILNRAHTECLFKNKSYFFTTVLKTLPWFSISPKVKAKLFKTTYKVLHGLASHYFLN